MISFINKILRDLYFTEFQSLDKITIENFILEHNKGHIRG